jgi:carboxyl-terminal processing protease
MEFKGSSAVKALAFSPDGRQLALGQDNGKVLVIESRQSNPIWSKRHLLPVSDMAYSPDGAFLAVAVQRNVYLYRVEGAVSPPLATVLAERQEGVRGLPAGQARVIALEAAAPEVSSRTMADVLQIAQDEYMRLLPFDRLAIRAVEAMVEATPGAAVDTQTDNLVLTAEGRSLTLDLRSLRGTSGNTGLRQTVRAYEAAQRFLLVSNQGSARSLEQTAVEGVLTELGPGVRVVSGQERRGPSRDSTTDAGAQAITASAWGRQEIIQTVFEGDVNYLKLPRFDQRTAGLVQVWMAGGMGSPEGTGVYLLDLRDNPGSELDPAVATAMRLLPKGHLITSVIARKNGDRTEYRSEGPARLKGRLVVLVNERTAGTAEMLACAVRESGAGVLVGVRTAGVDEVYTTFSLPDGSGLRISTGRFYCPGDYSLRWVGQPVDVEVSATGLGFSPRDYQVGPMAVTLPARGDRQLRVGVGVARCLSQVPQGIRVGARVNGQGSVAAAMLAECSSPLH